MDMITKIVLEVMEEITGLPKEELEENMDLNLKEEGLLDSVSIAALIIHIERHLKKKIKIDVLDGKDFDTINTIITGVERAIQ